MKALIHVTLKPDVLDPQGKAIRNACASLGYEAVADVRQGKLFEIRLEAPDEAQARALLTELCEKLIANPVIEEYEIVRVDP
ncbi:MAG: phosphoribosylformylglycinamidine synthase subunit PurS [Myxococcales bacterium]|nr:phosphoribosylformylglycinamidine synthase subunit PurS [Myxococcales bacterium]MDH5306093.1 phosphoribosylformylglycinamidine synthase subunit PurS [Myxococcales bacterium]MDH5566064.1 phosphoribosylformylglycinamidine synthase subunit PurS [Myxococcales bacterium]